jgi:hypothetical protein
LVCKKRQDEIALTAFAIGYYKDKILFNKQIEALLSAIAQCKAFELA